MHQWKTLVNVKKQSPCFAPNLLRMLLATDCQNETAGWEGEAGFQKEEEEYKYKDHVM